jgi:hypothetical protein
VIITLDCFSAGRVTGLRGVEIRCVEELLNADAWIKYPCTTINNSLRLMVKDWSSISLKCRRRRACCPSRCSRCNRCQTSHS